jgi:hypothetical protein
MFIFERRALRLRYRTLREGYSPIAPAGKVDNILRVMRAVARQRYPARQLIAILIVRSHLNLYDVTSCRAFLAYAREVSRTNSLGFVANLRMSQPDRAMERRRHQRTELNEPAYVSSGGSVMGCMVRNISAEGAAIDVDNAAFVPSCFRLVMAADRSVRDCKVVWIRDNRIGVSFLT